MKITDLYKFYQKLNYKCPFDGTDYSCDGNGPANTGGMKGASMVDGTQFENEYDGRVAAAFQGTDGQFYVAGIDKKKNKKRVYKVASAEVGRFFASKFATKNDDLDGGYDQLEEVVKENEKAIFELEKVKEVKIR